jgi:hypothetical protein
MRLIRTLTVAATLFAAGIGLAPRQAYARPCCEVCDQLPNGCPNGCTEDCNPQAWQEALHMIYDEQMGLCYVAE